jgi:hypothetical protein
MSAHGPDAGRGSCLVIIMLELVLVVSVGGCASHRRTVSPSSASSHVTFKKAKLQNETKDEKTNISTEPCSGHMQHDQGLPMSAIYAHWFERRVFGSWMFS